MSESTSALGPPPRSHSLRESPEIAKTTGDAATRPSSSTTSDYYDSNDDYDSTALIEEAQDAVTRVDDGWSATELLVASKKLIERVQQLTSILNQLQEAQRELQNSLTVTKSNLTLALSNTEMLEEALQRADSAKGKDIGWRRWSDRELLSKKSVASSKPSVDETARPVTNGPSPTIPEREPHIQVPELHAPRNALPASAPPHPLRSHSDISPSSAQVPAAGSSSSTNQSRSVTPSETGFFTKLRFGGSSILGGSRTPTPQPPTPTPASQLTSASLPALNASLDTPLPRSDSMLSASPVEEPSAENAANNAALVEAAAKALAQEAALERERNRVAELEALLEAEKKSKAEITAQKAGIESEIEGLSAALFEEANKMVALERKKRAAAEEELQFEKDEKEALKSALKIVESENVANKLAASRPQTPRVPSSDELPPPQASETVVLPSTPNLGGEKYIPSFKALPLAESSSQTLAPSASTPPSIQLSTSEAIPGIIEARKAMFANKSPSSPQSLLSTDSPTRSPKAVSPTSSPTSRTPALSRSNSLQPSTSPLTASVELPSSSSVSATATKSRPASTSGLGLSLGNPSRTQSPPPILAPAPTPAPTATPASPAPAPALSPRSPPVTGVWPPKSPGEKLVSKSPEPTLARPKTPTGTPSRPAVSSRVAQARAMFSQTVADQPSSSPPPVRPVRSKRFNQLSRSNTGDSLANVNSSSASGEGNAD